MIPATIEVSVCVVLASNPGSHPAFRRLQYGKAECTASDEKLDESLGSRLCCTAVSATFCLTMNAKC